MSVYKHPNGKTYNYDFKFRGVRFSRSTGAKTEREARKVEARVRAELEAGITTGRPKLKEMPLRVATARYWTEHAQYLADADTVFGQLGRLVDGFGPNKLLSQITSDDLVVYQSQARRTRKGHRGKPISNRTINGEVPELIGAIYKRAKLWKVNRGELGDFEFSQLKLALPAPRARTASRREEVLVLRNLRRDYRPIIRFAILSGLRRAQLLLTDDNLDWDQRVLEYTKKSKHTGNKGWLPITRAMEKILRAEIAKRPAGCLAVFTYQCRRGKADGRRPITLAGLSNEMKKAVAAAGLPNWRLIHDLRHTAATRSLRKTNNLRLVQQQLGHSNIGQTSRYAHVLMDDLRAGMESQ